LPIQSNKNDEDLCDHKEAANDELPLEKSLSNESVMEHDSKNQHQGLFILEKLM